MNTKVHILYCHATGRARISVVELGADCGKGTASVVEHTVTTLKAYIMACLMEGREVTIKSV